MGLLGKLFGKRDKAAALPATETVRPRVSTVKFDQSRVTDAIEAEVRSTLQGVSEMGASKLAPAYNAALQSVRAGRDLKVLCDVLVNLGLTRQRASEVAMLVNNQATSLMDRERQGSLGITEAVWLHSGAPCMTNRKTPSPEDRKRSADHLTANGKRYAVAEGMLMNGRRVWPGQEPGCKCISKPVISGFS